MKQKIKKGLAVLLVFAMLFTLVPAGAFAAENGESITLNLESPRGLKETITIDIKATVADLKAAVAEKCNVTFGEGSEYRLFGEDLKYPNSSLSDDTKVLKDIGFANNQTIHLEKSTSWDASGSEPIKIFGLTITGGKGSQEPYGDYGNVDYYWNYYYKTITIKSTANITISGTGEHNTNIIIKKAGNGKYTNLTISDLHLTTDAGACINVQSNSWVKLTVAGNNTLTATGKAAQYTVDKMPALTLTNSGAYLKIMKASTGTLTATTNIAGQPGIGTYDNTSSVWGVEINGGTVIANGGEGAAGIRAQAVCIYGGDVTANGGIDGYGTNNLYPYSIEILGGTVTANSKDGKALTAVPNLESYKYYKAVASVNADGINAVKYDSTVNDTYKYFKIEPVETYDITISETENGTVTADISKAIEGETVTLTVEPAEGCKLESLIVDSADVTAKVSEGKYIFEMPAKAVTVTATFKEIVTYPVYVGGIQFTENNLTVTDENGGTATYDPETNTLTLNNYSISNENGAGIKANGDLTITGNGTITGSTYGVYTDGMLHIKEGSNIVFQGETAAIAVGGGIGMTNVIITEPVDYVQGSVDVGKAEDYTTFGTEVWNDETGESVFVPAKTVNVEPGFLVYFDAGESMDYIEAQEVVSGGKAVKPADPTLEGYAFGGWYIDSECTEAYDFGTAVTKDYWLYAKWTKKSTAVSGSGSGFSGVYNYPVNIGTVAGADVTFSDSNAIAGETVTITVKPDAGKQVDEVIVTDADGDVIPVTKVGDNQYSFIMPESKVSVAVTTEAADYDKRIVLQINNKNILLDNKTIGNDVAPVIAGDRTLVPVRIVTELLGGTADWDNATRTVTLTIDGKVLKLVIGQPIPGFGTSATIMNDRTYVPIRYVAEKLGANVEWIAQTQQIIIEQTEY